MAEVCDIMIQIPSTLQLCARHLEALRKALAFVFEIVEPIGVVATGSIIRGNPNPASDLDIVILHGEPWRRRIQRFFNDTPTELFFNPEEWLSHDIRQEAAHGRPVMAHMLATGVILLDTGEQMSALVEQSRATLLRGPRPSAEALLRECYAAACLVEDALDLDEADALDRAQHFASAVQALVRHDYLRRNLFLPRPKERLRLLQIDQPELYALLEIAHFSAFPEASEALRKAARLVLGTTGFFEWDSGKSNAGPPRIDN
jgi:hypothetical protein